MNSEYRVPYRQPITTHVSHANPHPDERYSHRIAIRFGEKQFGKAGHVELRFMSATTVLDWSNADVARLMTECGWDKHTLPCALDADELEKHGVLFIGTGGGRFDEHPRVDQDRKENISCARLVADALGDDLPAELADLTDYIDNEDTRARRPIPDPFELSSFFRVLQANGVVSSQITQLMDDVITGRLNWPVDVDALDDLFDWPVLNAQIVRFLCDQFNGSVPVEETDPLKVMDDLGVLHRPDLAQLVDYLNTLPRRIQRYRNHLAYHAGTFGAFPLPPLTDDDVADNAALNRYATAHDINQDVMDEILKLYKRPVDSPLVYELACLPNLLYGSKESPVDVETHMPLIQWLLKQKFLEQEYFHGELTEEYKRVTELRTCTMSNGQECSVAFIESANTRGLDRVARLIDRVAFIVIRNPETGNVQILSSLNRLKRLGIGHSNFTLRQNSHLDEIAKVIRITERRLAGRLIPFDPIELRSEGSVRGAECWYYDRRAPFLLNGSRSAPDAPATLIPWEDMKDLVMLALDPAIMPGECGACLRDECPMDMYRLYLNRCYAVREKDHLDSESNYMFSIRQSVVSEEAKPTPKQYKPIDFSRFAKK